VTAVLLEPATVKATEVNGVLIEQRKVGGFTIQVHTMRLDRVKTGTVVLYDGAEYKIWRRYRVVKPGGVVVTASPRIPGGWAVDAVALYYASDDAPAEAVVGPR
jgi:hypothetical protein